MNWEKVYWWIENESDRKYMKLLIDGLKSLGRNINVFDRVNKTIIYSNGETEYMSSPVELFKKLDDEHAILISGYNTRKRAVEKYENIKVIQLSHSMSGWTGYHMETFISYYDNMTCIYPDLFRNAFMPENRKSLVNNYDKYDSVNVKQHYRLLYHLKTRFGNEKSDGILFLPHWTTSIATIYEMMSRVKTDKTIYMKIHPSEVNEKQIFLNRQVVNKIVNERIKDIVGPDSKLSKSEIYNKLVERLTSDYNVVLIPSDTDIIEVIDKFDTILFDNCSNTLVESIFRGSIYNDDKKIAILDPVHYDNNYYLPYSFGYDVLDTVSDSDFKSLKETYDVGYIEYDDIIKDYDRAICEILERC